MDQLKRISVFLIVPFILFFECTGRTNARIIFVPAEYNAIQDAIDNTVDGDLVLVADGIYQGVGNREIDFKGKQITVRSENGPVNCILDCQNETQGVTFWTQETRDSILQGFTITNAFSNADGGGIFCYRASPRIISCVIVENFAHWDGAGIACRESSAILINCVISRNSAFASIDNTYGGGLSAWLSSLTLINCLITNNQIDGAEGNPLEGYGGGAFLDSIGSSGSGMNQLINCTISENSILLQGDIGGLMASGSISLVNCIVWSNHPNSHAFYGEAGVTYSDIDGGFTGIGNLNADPVFVDAEEGAFFLSQLDAGQSILSPCVGAGSDFSSNSCFDIVDERICLDQLTTRTDGGLDAGIVDMGFHYVPPVDTPPTPTPTCETTVKIWMPSHEYQKGDDFACSVIVCNDSDTPLQGYPLFVILEFMDVYYFAPSFTAYDHYAEERPQFETGETAITVIETIEWPEVFGVASARWLAALTTPDITHLLGDPDVWEFNWK